MALARRHVQELEFTFTDTILIRPSLSRSSDRIWKGIVIASKTREERCKKRHEGGKGKAKRTCPKGSTPSPLCSKRVQAATEEDVSLDPSLFIPTPVEGKHFQPFKVLSEEMGGARKASSTTSSEGEQHQSLENPYKALVSV